MGDGTWRLRASRERLGRRTRDTGGPEATGGQLCRRRGLVGSVLGSVRSKKCLAWLVLGRWGGRTLSQVQVIRGALSVEKNNN